LLTCGFAFVDKMIRGRCGLPYGVRQGRIEHVIEQLATATDDELLAEVVQLQARTCREQYAQLAVLAELNARNVAGVRGYRGLAQLIAEQVRCTAVEARERAVAVERFGARRAVTGETLQPVYPATADAFAGGEISPEHASVIAETVEAIPVVDRAEHATAVEATLLEQARTGIRTRFGCWVSGSLPISIRTGPARRNRACSRCTGS
jgi:hypothetical protein